MSQRGAARPIAVTMGDPAGIGPEVIVKALVSERLAGAGDLLVVGDIRVLQEMASQLGLSVELAPVSAGSIGSAEWRRESAARVLDLGNADPATFELGKASVIAAARRCRQSRPRRSWHGTASRRRSSPRRSTRKPPSAAGYHDIGHLEYLARVTKSTEYATMLVTGRLRVVHLTTHYSLRDACDRVRRDAVLGKIQADARLVHGVGARRRRASAVAALNPHGGEGGMFGREEIEEIAPAVEAARAEGIDARGPYPADSIFNRAIDGEFDAVVAMYHDQGHIPIKVHCFAESVSVSLGLPLVRTSVDHGTAFGIAGQGCRRRHEHGRGDRGREADRRRRLGRVGGRAVLTSPSAYYLALRSRHPRCTILRVGAGLRPAPTTWRGERSRGVRARLCLPAWPAAADRPT